MTVAAILLPVFALVLLSLVLLFVLDARRKAALRGGQVELERVPLDERAWPARVRQTGNAFRNQFELPVLFYALVAFALITRKADLAFVVLSWVFVLSRIAHALVHVTSNEVRLRSPLYFFGVTVLLIMWVLFAFAILFSPVLP